MAFALAVTHLLEAMQKPGCPICRLFRQGARRAVESFLWENVNDPEVRQGILASYGFCPLHTRLMVAQELSTSSVPLGTNIIYEHLGRVVAGELRHLAPKSGGSAKLRNWLRQFGLFRGSGIPLLPKGPCPVCEAGNNAALNSLHVLCEELEKEGDVRTAYQASDGVCLAHLRAAVDLHAARFPQAVQYLVKGSADRLEQQSVHMQEFIRKSNWSYREEKLTEEEDTAWRKTLTFFTGYPGESFNHKLDDF